LDTRTARVDSHTLPDGTGLSAQDLFGARRDRRSPRLLLSLCGLCFSLWIATVLPLGCQYGSMSLLNPHVHAGLHMAAGTMKKHSTSTPIVATHTLAADSRPLGRDALFGRQLRQNNLDRSLTSLEPSSWDARGPFLLPDLTVSSDAGATAPVWLGRSGYPPDDPPPRV
jgi:hypothetical protein